MESFESLQKIVQDQGKELGFDTETGKHKEELKDEIKDLNRKSIDQALSIDPFNDKELNDDFSSKKYDALDQQIKSKKEELELLNKRIEQ